MNIELRLLAAMLQSGDFGPLIRQEIKKDHFATTEGDTVYNFITNYRSETDNKAAYPSLAIVQNRFSSGALELPELAPSDTVANLTHELQIQHFRAVLRDFASQAETIAEDSDPIGQAKPLIEKLKAAVEKTHNVEHTSLATGIRDVVERYKSKEILPDGIPWPWLSMNKATKGLHPGELVIFAGRPKSRKTFTALRVGVNAVKEHHARVLVFSPEMKPKLMLLRCIAHLCNLPYYEFKNSALDEAQEAMLLEAAERYGKIEDANEEAYQWQLMLTIPELASRYVERPQFRFPSLDIVQSTGRDVAWMESQIKTYEPDLVICDSFYRQRGTGQRRNDSDWKAMGSLSRELKDLFMAVNVAGLGTHQLNREAERSLGGLSNLALADAFGQDADGIWRIVTGKIEGAEASAILNLGGREVPFEGVIIANKPCFDYDEKGEITSKKMVADLMRMEEDAAAREDADKVRENFRRNGSNAKPNGHFQRPNGSGQFRLSPHQKELMANSKELEE